MFGKWLREGLSELWQILILPPGLNTPRRSLPDTTQLTLPSSHNWNLPSPVTPSSILNDGDSKLTPTQYQVWRDHALQFFTNRGTPGIRIPRSLSLAKLRIRTLPEGLSIGGDLDLRRCQRLRRIGDGLQVKGDLRIGGRYSPAVPWERELANDKSFAPEVVSFKKLSGDHQCPIDKLPEGLTVGGNLELRSCPNLTELPKKYRLGGDVVIESCHALRRLPDPFVVVGNLTLKGCRGLKELPAKLCVAGDLRLIGVPIRRLPEKLKVEGSLILENCSHLSELPSDLTVFEDLVVRRCPIKSLPERLMVVQNLTIDQCSEFEEIPTDLHVGKDIWLNRCASMLSFPSGLDVQGGLRVTRCPEFCDLPDGLAVPKVLSLSGCSAIEGLPRGMRIGHEYAQRPRSAVLKLNNCLNLTEVANDLQVSGPIDVAGSGLTGLPKRLEKNVQLLWRGMAVRPAVVFHPESLQAAEILGERNTELRRIMLERVGLETLLSKSRAKVLDEDTDPGGPRRLVEVKVGFRQHRYLHCRCPSTGRHYLLRVPPHVAHCRAAAAWLAGFNNPDDYRPVQET